MDRKKHRTTWHVFVHFSRVAKETQLIRKRAHSFALQLSGSQGAQP